jgi:hypothetical protein
VRDAEGRLVGFTKISRDLTARRELEQERARARELHDRVDEASLSEGDEVGSAPGLPSCCDPDAFGLLPICTLH